MPESSSSSSGGIGICGMLFVLFVGLKLCGVIEWSWYWVSAPLWIPVVLVLFVLVVALVGYAAIRLFRGA